MMMTIIIVLFSLSLVHLSSEDDIFRTDLGQDVTFSCMFGNEYEYNEVSFMHQTTGDILSVGLDLFLDDSIGNNHMQLIRFAPNRLDLKIFSVNENDSGLYTCMINEDKLSSFLLEIFIPPRFVWYSPSEGNLAYPEGSSMNLSCRSFAIPPANMTWIYRDRNKQSKMIHSGEDLYISSVNSSDSGSYECIASNGYHATISRSFYVTVQYPPRVRNNKFFDIHKSFIELICEICAMPLSNIQWIRNEKVISNDEYFHIKTESKSDDNEQCLITVLTVDNSSREKYGRYECRSENFLGYKSEHIDYYPHIASKSSSDSEQISFITLQNQTKQISNSSDCIFRLSTNCLLSIIILFHLICSK